MFRTNKASSFTAAALRGTERAVEAKGSSWSQTMGCSCGCPGSGGGRAGKRLPPKPGLGNPRDGVCRLWRLERDGGLEELQPVMCLSFLTWGLKGLVGSHAMQGSGGAAGCFCPPRKLLNQVKLSS